MEKPQFQGILRQYGTACSKVALAHRLSNILGWGWFSAVLSGPEGEDSATEVNPGTWQSVSVFVVESVLCGSQNVSQKIEASSSSLGDSDQVDKGTWLRAIPCLGMYRSEVPSKMSLQVSTCWCGIDF